jgi:hypothetical protein
MVPWKYIFMDMDELELVDDTAIYQPQERRVNGLVWKARAMRTIIHAGHVVH